MKYSSTIQLVQTWLTNCPAGRRALLKVAHPVLTKCLQPTNPSKPLCSWFPRGFPRIQGGVLSASREGGAAENQSLCPPPPTHNRTGTAQLSSRRCNYRVSQKNALSECCWTHSAAAQSPVANTPCVWKSILCTFLTKTKPNQALPSYEYGKIWPNSAQFWL